MDPRRIMRPFNRYFKLGGSLQKYINGHLITGSITHAAYRKNKPAPETSTGIDQILI